MTVTFFPDVMDRGIQVNSLQGQQAIARNEGPQIVVSDMEVAVGNSAVKLNKVACTFLKNSPEKLGC